MQAIIAGTRNAARVLRLDQLGMLAPGKGADFLVLDANPLDDITNVRRLQLVLKEGRVISDKRHLSGAVPQPQGLPS